MFSVGIFADGVAVEQVGKNNFDVIKECIDGVITVTIDEVCAAVKDLFEDTRVMSEPAGAVALAGLKKYASKKNKHLLAISSGANQNFDRLSYIVERSELGEDKEKILSIQIPEKAGRTRERSGTPGVPQKLSVQGLSRFPEYRCWIQHGPAGRKSL